MNCYPKITISEIGIRVGPARKGAGFTQYELSKLIGFKNRQTLSQIERGERKIKPEELVKIMELTGKDLNYFSDPFRLTEKIEWHFHIKETV